MGEGPDNFGELETILQEVVRRFARDVRLAAAWSRIELQAKRCKGNTQKVGLELGLNRVSRF